MWDQIALLHQHVDQQRQGCNVVGYDSAFPYCSTVHACRLSAADASFITVSRPAAIFDNDILVVDRAVKPRHNHIVVAVVDGDFTVKYLYQRSGRTKLKAANPTFPDIVPKDGQTIEVWGVVTSSIKQFLV